MSKIVSIHSFRGGTGKSNTTANVASQLALNGKRVAIVDTDIQSPGIHVPFGLSGETMGLTLNDYLAGKCKITEAAYNIGEHTGGEVGRKQLAGKNLWLVPSSIDLNEITKVLRDGYDVNQLNAGLKQLRRELELDYLLIDTHPGLNEETLLSVAISDLLIIILRTDQQDFQGTAVTVDLARTLGVPNLILVVNKALLSRYDASGIKESIEKTYNAPVAAVLPLSEDMVDLQSADIFSLVMPDHRWSKGIRDVADMVMGL